MRAARRGTKGESMSMGIIMGMMAKEVLKAPKPITSMNSWPAASLAAERQR